MPKVMKIKTVIKDSGDKEKFDWKKVEKSVVLAGKDTKAFNKTEAKKVLKKIKKELYKVKDEQISTEKIREIVEPALAEAGYFQTAKYYILYKEKKEQKKSHEVEIKEPELSDMGMEIAKKRYLRTDMKGKVVETPGELFWRVAQHMAKAEIQWSTNGEVRETANKFYERMINWKFVCAGKAMFEAGNPGGNGQMSSCFVLPIEDSIQSIFKTLGDAAVVHKNNGGTGFNFSKIRPHGDKVKNVPGAASGPVDFLRAFSAALSQILQGSKRQGANIAILNCDHPDVEEFIHLKDEDGTIKNFNISVGVTNEFMEAVERDEMWELKNPRNGEVWKKMKARELFDQITEHAWVSGDPGLAFLDRMEEDNPTPTIAKLDATNPCVTGDTWVMTSEGPRQAAELVDKEFQAVVDGKNYYSSGFFVTGRKEIFEIKTNRGFGFRATENHPVRVVKKRTRYTIKKEWKNVGDLQVGDEVLLHNHDDFKWDGRGNAKEGWLMGSLVGDGNITKEGIANLDYWGQEQEQMMNYAVSYIHATVGCRSDLVGHVAKSGYARLKSKSVGLLAKEFGLKNGNKRVTKAIEMTSSSFHEGFLQGWFDADGSVQGTQNKGVSVRLASSSLLNLQAAQRMLARLGVMSKIYPFRRKAGSRKLPDGKGGQKRYDCRADHELVVSGENLFKFAKRVNFLQSEKEEKLTRLLSSYKRKLNKEKFITKVTEISSMGKKEVFDCQVDDVHAFDGNGVYLHNCGEIPLLPYESCNLTSICLHNHLRSGKGDKLEIDWEDLEKSVRLGVRFLDDMIEVNTYALPEIEQMVKNGNRRIGLGVMGFAHMLYLMGIPYNSQEAVRLANRLAKFIHKTAESESLELAKVRGTFPNWDISVYAGTAERYRNCALTMIAPTGTISLLANTSSGIEPVFSLVTLRRAFNEDDKQNRPTREFMMVDPVFEQELKRIWNKELRIMNNGKTLKSIDSILAVVAEEGLSAIEGLPKEFYKRFVTTHEIAPTWHVKIQAAWQKWFDNSISKTINFPHDANVEDVRKAYLQAWKLGCKGITIYRDGSKQDQVLNLARKKKMEAQVKGKEKILRSPQTSHSLRSSQDDKADLDSLLALSKVNEENVLSQAEQMHAMLQVGKSQSGEATMCPECGAAATFADGCATCVQCGWSKCSL